MKNFIIVELIDRRNYEPIIIGKFNNDKTGKIFAKKFFIRNCILYSKEYINDEKLKKISKSGIFETKKVFLKIIYSSND